MEASSNFSDSSRSGGPPSPLRPRYRPTRGQSNHPLRLLSLDGGGVRGYSILLLIEDLMLKLFVELEGRAPRPDEPLRPCEYFDLIAGTGTGGLVAILLGRLRLDVETSKAVYTRVVKKVFESDKIIAGLPYRKTLFKASRLEEAVKEVVREYLPQHQRPHNQPHQQGHQYTNSDAETISNFFPPMSPISPASENSRRSNNSYGFDDSTSEGDKSYGRGASGSDGGSVGSKKLYPPGADPGDALLYDSRIDRCKTFLTAVYKGSDDSVAPAILRTYESSHSASPSPRCTIWEAGRATCAHYPAFKPIQIGHDVFMDEGPGRYSPIAQVLEEALVYEWPGREVGVVISIGCGKRPVGGDASSGESGHGTPHSLLRSTPLGKFADARARHEQKMMDTETVHLEILEGLHRTGVARENYFRLNVDTGIGDYGINEWSRMAEISTSTRKYLSRLDVQAMKLSAAEKLAEIHRTRYGLPSAAYKQSVLNRELPPDPPNVDSDEERFDSDEEVMSHLEELQRITRKMHV